MKRANMCMASLLTGATALTLLTGCATSPPMEQAMVCPQCKEITIERLPLAYSPDEGISYAYWDQNQPTVEHSCPGCQGAITTLFKEGKLQHKCSICAQSPFSCPVSHR